MPQNRIYSFIVTFKYITIQIYHYIKIELYQINFNNFQNIRIMNTSYNISLIKISIIYFKRRKYNTIFIDRIKNHQIGYLMSFCIRQILKMV